MATNHQTVFSFLNVTESLSRIDRKNLEQIRSAYTNMIKNGSSSIIDDQLKALADEFMIANDTTNLDHLKICVLSKSSVIACQEIWAKYIDTLSSRERNSKKMNQISTSTSAKPIPRKPIVTESLSQATCQIFIKRNQPVLIEFIQNFLLSPLDQNTSRQGQVCFFLSFFSDS